MSSRLLEGLNAAQREAVMHGEGPLLVLAGPGSGKTRVITHRIAHLIEEWSVPPREIVAVTFTNKAADEMRRRLDQLIPGQRVLATTFHRLCVRLLRQFGERVGLESRFSIIDPSERRTLIKEVMRAMDLDVVHLPPESVERRISDLKNDLVSAESFAEQAEGYVDQMVASIYPRLEEEMRRQNAVDFDDLLYLTAHLLRTEPEVRQRLDRGMRYVLVDEYQDTNLAQYAIARGLSVDHPNLCVTGDPDQSIYSWRGANIANILNFEEDFPSARVVRLEENYRSTGHILGVADELIRHNVNRKAKDLRTENPIGALVRVVSHRDHFNEARYIADRIRESVEQSGRRYRDHAVFVRTAGLFPSLEQAFRTHMIPYQVVGGFAFFERKEIRDILGYVRLLLNPRDVSAFKRVVKTPPKGIGDTSLDRLLQYAERVGLSPPEACRHADSIPGLKRKQVAALVDLRVMLDEVSSAVEMSPVAGLAHIIDGVGYREYLAGLSGDDSEERALVLDEFLGTAQDFQLSDPEASLAEFVEQVSLASDADRWDDERDSAMIMTMHAAKGLEFPVVFVVAFEDRIIPHERAVEERGEEEERRLLFVAITRAEEELTLSYVRSRMMQGSRMFAAPSPFLIELPNEHLDRQDVVSVSPRWSQEDDDVNQESDYEEPAISVDRSMGEEIPIYQGSTEPSPADRYTKGMWVRHQEYGDGVILQIEGAGTDRKGTIHFSTVGTKRFMLHRSSLIPMNAEDDAQEHE